MPKRCRRSSAPARAPHRPQSRSRRSSRLCLQGPLPEPGWHSWSCCPCQTGQIRYRPIPKRCRRSSAPASNLYRPQSGSRRSARLRLQGPLPEPGWNCRRCGCCPTGHSRHSPMPKRCRRSSAPTRNHYRPKSRSLRSASLCLRGPPPPPGWNCRRRCCCPTDQRRHGPMPKRCRRSSAPANECHQPQSRSRRSASLCLRGPPPAPGWQWWQCCCCPTDHYGHSPMPKRCRRSSAPASEIHQPILRARSQLFAPQQIEARAVRFGRRLMASALPVAP